MMLLEASLAVKVPMTVPIGTLLLIDRLLTVIVIVFCWFPLGAETAVHDILDIRGPPERRFPSTRREGICLA
jgi:hypothetical protein